MIELSDYIVYVDESGNHALRTIEANFPVFALSFCVVSKVDYTNVIVPAVQEFKFRYWGHDMVILHEREIRKEQGDFSFLLSRDLRERFMSDLDQIVSTAPMSIIASVIDKIRLQKAYDEILNPYEIALHFCLECLFDFLIDKDQEGKRVHVVFERRGAAEDHELELEFRRICDGRGTTAHSSRDFTRIDFEPRFAGKSVNSTGLQLADLTARPIALQTIRPEQTNRAFNVIQPKLVERRVFP